MLALLALLLFPLLVAAQRVESPPIVQAILFYSPTCPHCHQVINELLIPMQEDYGDQLQIIGIDTTDQAGSILYGLTVEHYEIPENKLGVPLLVVADTYLVGSMEIPARFPGIVMEGLAAGGLGWPDIPQLQEIVQDLPPSADPAAPPENNVQAGAAAGAAAEADTAGALPAAPEETTAPTAVAAQPAAAQDLEEAQGVLSHAGDAAAEPPPDPAGFALAWIVLLGMAAALLYALRQIWRARPLLSENSVAPTLGWLVPLLALLGLGAASYLAYVEVNSVEAVCGPVGECNIVQSSPYAQLFGVPIAIWGMLSYLAILALWAGERFLSSRGALWCALGLVLLTLFGTLFSIYLTLLELFAIKAICLWCLSSAVLTTSIMVLVTRNLATRKQQEPVGSLLGSP